MLLTSKMQRTRWQVAEKAGCSGATAVGWRSQLAILVLLSLCDFVSGTSAAAVLTEAGSASPASTAFKT